MAKLRNKEDTDLSDVDLGETGDETTLSKREMLDRYMAGMSFRPKKARAPGYLEYYRVYSDPSGKVGRVIAVVKKDATGQEPERPEYFTVTLQIHVDASREAVDRKAPGWAKKELSSVLSLWDEIDARQEISKTKCDGCGAQVTDFTTVQAQKLCASCLATRFTNG